MKKKWDEKFALVESEIYLRDENAVMALFDIKEEFIRLKDEAEYFKETNNGN